MGALDARLDTQDRKRLRACLPRDAWGLPRLTPVDGAAGSLECGFYIQCRCVEQVRVWGRLQGGDGPRPVALVPLDDLLQDEGVVGGLAPSLDFPRAPTCPLLGRGRHEEL